MKRNTWIGLGIGIAVVAGGTAYVLTRPKDEIKWRSGKVERGNITQRINATGAVSPVVQVAVGTQVSGVISALYVDYNSIVKKGQLIAQIDPTIWETQLADAKAGLERAKTNMDDARRQYERAKRLAADKLLADQDLEAKQVAYQTAVTSMENAKASMDRAKANLDYCNITAPVDGVVISRLADVGQTVAASFSTPNLFQIAQDLSAMKVQVNIGESDIDEIKVGQRAMFTVDSLPDKQFTASVSLVRQEPITTQNVVNYVVEMIVPNEPLPGSEEDGKAPATREAGKGGGGEAGGHSRGAGKAGGQEGAPDPEKAWERMKDRLPAGTTKQEFFKRFKERQAAGALKAMPAVSAAPNGDPRALARIPGGASQLGGPKFTGNLALRSGMTANVTISTNQRRDVLRVPNAALRFNPAAFLKDDKKADGPRLGQPAVMGGGPPRPAGAQTGTGSKGGMVARREDRVWVLENGKPKAIVVKAGISDGQFTEVSGEGLTEGMQVLMGVDTAKQASGSPAPLGGAPGGGRR
ncbi:MAG: efflux RND transporter periplasmic adaptor subunit [Geothrix sp.]|uniref:efflux RND transporter periplasmic adaptor subunit n=1 Tax=Geothrix sp. TaxID=1962974 RepID=UPI0017FAD79B|nr:efflux RND transporter periplasmic adaptor subunit [Geothrix sp.]NWJ40677.1 efflux RND transporter periplasmic adaptor subunit [Geothrix sp.]WIL21315.1 MAG: efflux RND transporter periplasmic adaptor subunit [Geothrix sp.]